MARFDKIIETGLRLIRKNGQQVDWYVRSTQDTSEKPWEGGSPPPPVKHTPFVCFVPVESKEDLAAFRFMTNIDVQVGSTFGLMGAVDFDASGNDYVVRDGKQYTIRKLDKLAPNGQVVIHYIEFIG